MARWLGDIGKGLGGGPGRGLTTRCSGGEISAPEMHTEQGSPQKRPLYIEGPKARMAFRISALQFLGQSEARMSFRINK